MYIHSDMQKQDGATNPNASHVQFAHDHDKLSFFHRKAMLSWWPARQSQWFAYHDPATMWIMGEERLKY